MFPSQMVLLATTHRNLGDMMVLVVVVLVAPLSPLRRRGHVGSALVMEILEHGGMAVTGLIEVEAGWSRDKACNCIRLFIVLAAIESGEAASVRLSRCMQSNA